jgi:hypothetical protein
VPLNAQCKSDIILLSSFIWCYYSPALCFTCVHFRWAWLSPLIARSTRTTSTGTCFPHWGTVVILSRQVCHLHYILVLQQIKTLKDPAAKYSNYIYFLLFSYRVPDSLLSQTAAPWLRPIHHFQIYVVLAPLAAVSVNRPCSMPLGMV